MRCRGRRGGQERIDEAHVWDMSHTPAKVAGGYFNSHRDQIASIRLFARTSTHAECATHDGSSRRSWKRVRVHMYVVDEQELLLRPDLQPDAVHHNPRIYAQEHTQYEARETVCLWIFGDQFTAGQNAVVARKVCSPTQVGWPSKTGAPVLSPGYVPSQPWPGRIPFQVRAPALWRIAPHETFPRSAPYRGTAASACKASRSITASAIAVNSGVWEMKNSRS